MGLQYERLWLKGQPWPLKLIYSHCLIRFNISSENNVFGFISIQKNQLLKKIPFKCIRKQIWPWRLVGQGQPRIIIWTNLVGPHIPNATYQVPRSLASWFWRRRFLKDLIIYGCGRHVTRTIWTNFRSRVLRSLHMKFVFNWSSGFRGEDVWKCWRTTDWLVYT